MRTINRSAVALALFAFAPCAEAADLAPPPAVAPAFNWTGLYLGVNGGGAWGSQNPYEAITTRFDNDTIQFGGGLVGGTAGAQIQVAHVVMGVETDLAWASLQGTATRTPRIFGTSVGFDVNATTKINWDLTFRARVGYAIDNWLPFVTAGAAVLGSRTELSTARGFNCNTFEDISGDRGQLNCSGARTRLGATLGAGLEYGFADNWSAKLEYRYTAAASFELSHINEVRAGVNYRFGGF